MPAVLAFGIFQRTARTGIVTIPARQFLAFFAITVSITFAEPA
jgi:hypothetical protein